MTKPTPSEIGNLRQWINEDVVTDPKKMVTNEMLMAWFKDDVKGELIVSNGRDMHGRGFTEWMCSHGIGHHKGIHGCDGCCNNAPTELWDKVTQD